MTLDKAIEILTLSSTEPQLYRGEVEREAQKLGIEALKAWKEHRGTGSLMSPLLLPGETKE